MEIHHPFTRHEAIAPPKKITVLPVSNSGDGQWDFVWHARLQERGWEMIYAGTPGIAVAWEKTVADGRMLYQSTRLAGGDETWTLYDRRENVVREWRNKGEHPGFFDFDPRGRLVYGEAGCLYAWSRWPDEEPRLIADLNANVFENVPPPNHARRR